MGALTIDYIFDLGNHAEVLRRIRQGEAKKMYDAIARHLCALASVTEEELLQIKNRLYDAISSCDLDEAHLWLDFYISAALYCGDRKPSQDLRMLFLAAFDMKVALPAN